MFLIHPHKPVFIDLHECMSINCHFVQVYQRLSKMLVFILWMFLIPKVMSYFESEMVRLEYHRVSYKYLGFLYVNLVNLHKNY